MGLKGSTGVTGGIGGVEALLFLVDRDTKEIYGRRNVRRGTQHLSGERIRNLVVRDRTVRGGSARTSVYV